MAFFVGAYLLGLWSILWRAAHLNQYTPPKGELGVKITASKQDHDEVHHTVSGFYLFCSCFQGMYRACYVVGIHVKCAPQLYFVRY